MPHLLRFIEGPTPSAVGVGYVQERVLLAVSMHQYLPVLPALKKVRGTWIYPQLVDVVIAQLEGDATRLNAMLSEPSTSKHAALALHWMGNDEVLRGVAGDRGHSAHAMARAVLEGQVEP